MKHLFIINSHTTFLSAMGTADYLHLPQNDVIFAYMRNYKNSVTKVPYKVIDVTELYDSTIQYYSGKPLSYVIKEIDEFVDHNIKENYSLYVSHLVVPLFKILYTNKLCKRVSYIQEGAFTGKNAFCTNISFVHKLKNFIKLYFRGDRWFDGEWYMAGTIYKQRKLDSYAINDKFWQYLPSQNHIISWPKISLPIDINNNYPIFIFDGYVANGMSEYDVYLSNSKRLVEEYSKDTNYIQFHPAQSEKERTEICNYFKEQNKSVKILSDTVPMEYIIISAKDLTFIGFGSSLLYYATDQGHKVVCHDDWFIENSAKYQNYKKRIGTLSYREFYNISKS